MSKCRNCNVEILDESEFCPLCHSVLEQTEELENMYPNLSPKQRENEIARKYRTVFLMQIGDKLKSGKPHDGRAPDYDDWSLNGDIILWNELLGCAFEISLTIISKERACLT